MLDGVVVSTNSSLGLSLIALLSKEAALWRPLSLILSSFYFLYISLVTCQCQEGTH